MMGFVTPFVTGTVIGALLGWQVTRRKAQERGHLFQYLSLSPGQSEVSQLDETLEHVDDKAEGLIGDVINIARTARHEVSELGEKLEDVGEKANALVKEAISGESITEELAALQQSLTEARQQADELVEEVDDAVATAAEDLEEDAVTPQTSGSPAARQTAPASPSSPKVSNVADIPGSDGIMSATDIDGQQPDVEDIEEIKGIGPIFAGRLREAGVTTFADIAQLDPERLLEIVSPERSMPLVDAEDWIEQARQFAAQRQG